MSTRTEVEEAVYTEGLAAGRVAERQRVRAILSCAEAKGKEALAAKVAFDTDMGFEEAQRLLNAAATSGRRNDFFAAMAAVPNPEVGVDMDGAVYVASAIENPAGVYAARRVRAPGEKP